MESLSTALSLPMMVKALARAALALKAALFAPLMPFLSFFLSLRTSLMRPPLTLKILSRNSLFLSRLIDLLAGLIATGAGMRSILLNDSILKN